MFRWSVFTWITLMDALSLFYLPAAFVLGGLHGLEPGHAKTLTAAYLIGTRGTKRDALVLGLSVAATHSIVVLVIAGLGLYLGQEVVTTHATRWLRIGSAVVVMLLGGWLLWRRWPRRTHTHAHHDHSHEHEHEHEEHAEHDDPLEAAHVRAHAATLPSYAQRGERPTVWQLITFGAAGGVLPCPASISVMLLALSLGRVALGFTLVLAFSVGLAVTLVGVGLLVVIGLARLATSGRLSRFTRHAPLWGAGLVILSGLFALLVHE